MLHDRSEYGHMAAVEGEHWWYRSLHALVAQALAAHPRGPEARVLDAGCGTGGLLRFLAERGFRRLSGFDVSPFAIEVCLARGLPVRQADLRDPGALPPPGALDAVVSTDTLYFFPPETQERIVRGWFETLAPGGMLILNLPALRCFRGLHDPAVGITRRFELADLGRLLLPAGFTPARVRFWPFLLSPGIYVTRLLQRCRLAAGPVTPRSDTRLPPRWLNGLFGRITRFETSRLPAPPFGSSLFTVARKPSRP